MQSICSTLGYKWNSAFQSRGVVVYVYAFSGSIGSDVAVGLKRFQ